MRFGWGSLGALAVFVIAAASALAQPAKPPSGKKPPPAEIVSIDLGWHKELISRDRWQPVTVWITSREKPFSGVLIAEFAQDTTQKAQVIVGPVATTPGMVTPVEIEIAPYRDAQELIITLTDGRFKTEAHYSDEPRSDQIPLPRIGISRSGLMLFVGRTSANKAVDVHALSSLNGQSFGGATPPRQPQFSEASVWEQMHAANIAPDRLPFSWIAYESADVVVCNASDINSLEPRAEAALAKWVETGGRLVVRVDPVGPVWPRFLPTDPFGAPVVGSQQQVVDPSEEFKTLLPRLVFSNFQARLLTLTEEGKSRGWTTVFAASKPGDDSAGALVAYGPHGLGMVTLVGFDPANIASLIDDEAIKDVWRRIIRPILPPHALLGGHHSQYGMWEPGDTEVIGATNGALDDLAVVPPIGAGVFWLIAAFMTLLAIAIGPFDAKFLKRRRLSQHSWLTALCWITVASIGAMLAPKLMRSGETVVGRMSVIDTLCTSEGTPIQTTSHGLTGIFAGRPIQVALEGARPGAWLKGVAFNLNQYGDQGRMAGLPNLTLIPNTQQADLPVRGAWAEQIGVPQWSFRTLADTTPMLPAQSSDIGARIRDLGADWEVTLTNVPASAVANHISVRIGDSWHRSTGAGEPSDDGRDRVFLVSKAASIISEDDFVRSTVVEQPYQIVERSAASLPWVRERAQAIDAMVGSRNYACVCVKLTGMADALKVVTDAKTREQRTSLLRLLTPMPVEDKQ